MAIKRGFGQQLRDARVSHGLTYGTVSRKLRIRPDILQAIEEEDFSTMPPRSYARGMVHAYANLLGLNADRLTHLYLQEVDNFESQEGRSKRSFSSSAQTRRSFDPQDFEPQTTPDPADAARERLRQRRARREGIDGNADPSHDFERDRIGKRRQGGHNTRTSDNAGALGQVRLFLASLGGAFVGAVASVAHTIKAAVSSRKSVDINHSIYADEARRGSFGASHKQMRGTSLRRSHHTIMSTKSFNFEGAKAPLKKLPFFIAVVIVLIILVVTAQSLFNKPASTANSASANASSAISVPISGLTDPGSAGMVEQEVKVVPIAPTAAVFTYEIADGEDCYLEIYLDGGSSPVVANTFTGPKRATYDVTGTLSFVTSRPGAVSLKLDGEAVELRDDNGDGVYTYEVDFSEILANWKEANEQ